MKLPLPQLESHLSKKLASIYIISGEEPLLIQETLDLLRKAATQSGFDERIRVNSESNTEWSQLLFSHTQSLSLFSTKRIIELDLTDIKLNAASSKILQEFATQANEDILLIIRAHKLDKKTEQTNWYQALDKISIIIPLWPITLEQLPQWIMQRAKKLNLQMTPTAANVLANQVEGNLLAAAQEMEKLSLLQPTGLIDPALIENTVTDSSHFDIFALVDCILSGNKARSLRILDNLAAEDTEPTLILWALTRELRTLADMAKQLLQGIRLPQLFISHRVWEKRQPSVRAFLQRHKQESCWALLVEAAKIDKVIKGVDKGNVWDELGRFILSF